MLRTLRGLYIYNTLYYFFCRSPDCLSHFNSELSDRNIQVVVSEGNFSNRTCLRKVAKSRKLIPDLPVGPVNNDEPLDELEEENYPRSSLSGSALS